MQLTFEARDVNGVLAVFQIDTSGGTYTVKQRLKEGATPQEDRWKTLGYYMDFTNALVWGLLRHGFATFPGTVQEVLTTLRELQRNIVDKCGQLFEPKNSTARFLERDVQTAPDLRVLTDRPAADAPTPEATPTGLPAEFTFEP